MPDNLQISEAELAALDAQLSGGSGSASAPTPGPSSAPQPFAPPDFGSTAPPGTMTELSLLDDVELDVKIELGRAQMYIEDVLSLGVGSVVELDKLAGDPVDVYINDRLVARGEVLVLNDNLCVRVNDILSPNPELEGSRS